MQIEISKGYVTNKEHASRGNIKNGVGVEETEEE